jgi:hypothetical protein
LGEKSDIVKCGHFDYNIMFREAANVKKEILKLLKTKAQKRNWLVRSVSNRIVVDENMVESVLSNLKAEGIVQIEQVNGTSIVSLVAKKC